MDQKEPKKPKKTPKKSKGGAEDGQQQVEVGLVLDGG
jgi:hypothetical protein